MSKQSPSPITQKSLMIAALFAALIAALAFFAGSASAQQVPTHFTTCVSGTGGNATVAIPKAAIMTHSLGYFSLEPGDEIAVFRPDKSICAGVLVWSDAPENMAITVWADDVNVTPEIIDGMVNGEEMTWMVWDSSENQQWDVNVEYVAESNDPYRNDGQFITNGLYLLSTFTPTAVTLAGFSVADGPPMLVIMALVGGLLLLTLVLISRRVVKRQL